MQGYPEFSTTLRCENQICVRASDRDLEPSNLPSFLAELCLLVFLFMPSAVRGQDPEEIKRLGDEMGRFVFGR